MAHEGIEIVGAGDDVRLNNHLEAKGMGETAGGGNGIEELPSASLQNGVCGSVSFAPFA
ncbi:hypothetical protein SLEP1_g29552 [Rubroshorea leprosula]|uniref:Uncharacterized protein n=1 Tax=Rubroshorea leprosula TaxID=152421 RepID=A0AAV5K6A3_9ROSI|nr:hypothetical protein SLEP1_g29552 [Rubroshorea leprosula]